MTAKRFPALAGTLAIALTVSVAGPASAFPAGGGGGGAVSPGPGLMMIPHDTGFRWVRISGRLLAEGEPVPRDRRIVRLRIGGSVIPMLLDSDAAKSEDLTLNRQSEYSREVYRALVTKQVQVIASQEMMEQIERQTDSPERLRVEGEVHGLYNPILKVDSIRRAR